MEKRGLEGGDSMLRFFLVLVVGAALLAMACSGGSKPKPGVATPDTTVGQSPTPGQSASPSGGQLPLRPAPDAFVRLSYTPGQAIDAKSGVFFMDTQTGAVEGWRLSDAMILADGDDPANCCFSNTVSDDNRFIFMRTSKTSWLLDRRSGKAVSWNPADMAFVASSPRYLLFERAARPGSDPNPEYDGRYTLVDENFASVSTFKLERGGRGIPHVLFSPDERTLIIPAGNKSWSDYTSLQQVDVATGAVRRLAELPAAPSNYAMGPPKFESLAGGSEFAVAVHYSREYNAPQGAEGELPSRILLRRYSWNGSMLSEFELPTTGVSLSPDGKLLAYDQAERTSFGGSEGLSEYWSNVVIADGHTGAELLRVRSASLYLGDGLGDAKWLADSSGLPIAVRASSPREEGVPLWRYRGFALLLPNEGRIERLKLAEDDLLAPIPSPDRPELFAVGHAGVLERGTGKRVSATVPSDVWFSHVPPWGSTSAELRFALPHGAHGVGYRGTFLAPRIEYPPFDNRLAIRVSGTGSCLNLRPSPSLSAATSVCLADGTELALSPSAAESPYLGLAAWVAEDTTWIRVRAASGDEGWASSEYLAW